MPEENEAWRIIGDKLRNAREYLELTQDEVAAAVNMSRSALSLIENGRRKVDAIELKRFAEIYGQPVDSFTGPVVTEPLPETVKALARAANELSSADQDELLRFAAFLQSRNQGSNNG